jgi:hypothetical protein
VNSKKLINYFDLKRTIIIPLAVYFSCFSISAQESQQVTIDMGLSQTYKGFFYLYNGIVEFGLTYNHQIIENLYAGASFHLDYLSRNNSSARTIVYKPKVNLNYNIMTTSWLSINPMVFAGYSFVNLSNSEFNYVETQNGFNTGAELKFIWYSKAKVDYYIFGRYDFIYLDEDLSFTRLEYYRKLHLSSFGIGIKIKPQKHPKYRNTNRLDQ